MVQNLSSIIGRMTDLAVAPVDRTLLAMVYGSYGSGKTTTSVGLAQTLIDSEAGERILYVDSAAGWVSLDNIPSLKDNVTRVAFNEYGDLPVLADAVKTKKKMGGIDFGKFKVVVIDEIDSIADGTLDEYLREKHGTRAGDQTPEAEGKDYKPMGDLVRQAVINFQRIGIHVILIAHDKVRKDHRNVEVTGPALSPQLKKGIINLMHVVAHATSEMKGTAKDPVYVRLIQAQPTMLVEAKTRIGGLSTVIKMDPFDFVDIVSDWVSPSGSMAEDLTAPEEQISELDIDELPTDGIPVADVEEDDAPAYSETD